MLRGTEEGKGTIYRSSAEKRQIIFLGLVIILCSCAAQAAVFKPPPLPQIPPLISKIYSNDLNHNAIDDDLDAKIDSGMAQLKSAVTLEQVNKAKSLLSGLVEVELVFSSQITQQQIDDFQSRGGQITYIYRSISYGWNGLIPLEDINSLPSLMGASLVLVQEAKPAALNLDVATQTGRVRPIWSSGFGGNPSGFDGSNTITIAIVDTGIDASHSDFSGRQVYWHDFSTDANSSPVDIIEHGSHVSGIALGTGAASGSGTGTLYFTDLGDLTGVPTNSFYPFPFGLPATSVTFTSVARWIGGGSTTLYQVYHTKGTSGGWTAISSVSGTSPLTLTSTFTGSTSRAYSTALLSKGSMKNFVITNSVTNYPGVGDGFNRLRGVAPGCNWAAAKVFTNAGTAYDTWISAAIDDLVSNRIADNIKVINMSLGTSGSPGIDTSLRQKVNTTVGYGIVIVIAAGNDGQATPPGDQIDDPGRAAMAITVAATNDENRLTDYSSDGFSSPGSGEDYKPDVSAPGGSADYQTAILSVDSGTADTASFPDQQSNDYTSMQGTSMSSPFAAGAVALVIDAMQQRGITWDFNSSQHPMFVKMLLCATASETNASRENNSNNPTLQRASAGPSGFPAGKDLYEGYGIINPDAAVEAVSLVYAQGSSVSDTFGSGTFDRRVWARRADLKQGVTFAPKLDVPSTGDFDLYLYSVAPGTYGAPVILASSTLAGNDVNESISYTPTADVNTLIVVKRISGSGTFTLSTVLLRVLTVSSSAGGTVTQPGIGSFSYQNNSVVNLVASANANYHFVNWTGTAVTAGRVADPNAAATTVTMDANYTVQANFTINQQSLATSTSAGGTVTTPGIGTFWYDFNTPASIVASANAHYHFVNWTGTAATAGKISNPNSPSTTVLMDANYTATANFAIDTFTLTYSAGAGGNLTGNIFQIVSYGQDGTVVTAVPNTGYHFVNWSDASAENPRTDVNVTSNLSVTANFAIDTFTLTYSAGSGGNLTGNTVQVVNYGQNGTAVTAVPNTGYHFVNWSDASTENPRTDVNVTSSISVTANFATDTFTLTYSAGSGGSLTGQTTQVINYGQNGTAVTAVPNTGYHFVNWSDASTQNPRTDVNITANLSVTANFAIDTFTLTYSASSGGSLTGETVQVINYGQNGTAVTAVPDTGYQFVNWSDASTDNPRTDINVTASLSVTANFALIQLTISASSDSNGSVEPQLAIVNYGASQDFNAIPNTGYEVSEWFLDDNSVQIGGNSYTLSNVTASHNIYVTFQPIKLAIWGIITEPDANRPVERVLISTDNNDINSVTDSNGFYQLMVSYGWSGVVTPQKEGYVFEPNESIYTFVAQDYNDVNYTAVLNTFVISGYVFDANSASPVNDVNVSAENGGGQWTSRYGDSACLTDVNGFYQVRVDYNWSGNVVPSKYAYIFEPNVRFYQDVKEDWNMYQDFNAILLTFKISGFIKNECNVPIASVSVTADSGGGESITDANGFYEVWVDYAWSGMITPGKAYYTFEPNNVTYDTVLEDKQEQNYLADNIYDLDCDGVIGWGDLAVLCDNWLDSSTGNKCDFNNDQIVNFFDFAAFIEAWINQQDQ